MGEASNQADGSIEALKERYRIEREKRVRADGATQYIEAKGIFRELDADPYVEPGFTRDPVVEETDVVVLGAGFGGMLTAARLRQAGIDNFRMIDKAGDFGGTWYWNRYPGAACDVESYIYLPLLEETGYIPTEKYAKAPEIFAYSQMLGRHFDLYKTALFQTVVTGTAWNEATARWDVITDRGDRLAARFLVLAGGILHKPKLPGIPGIETFKGHAFHTTRWDYGYTGGSATTPMTGLADKIVGIIGTGATSVQAVPKLAADAEHLYVFQRTPSAVGVRGNRPTDPEWAKTLQPGWQRHRIDNFSSQVTGYPVEEDLIKDGWTDMLGGAVSLAADAVSDDKEATDFAKMGAIRARIDSVVKDPATAEALKPWYNTLCKRPCFHDEYLLAFNQPNVTLVDTAGKGVERITEHGVVVAGKEYPVDCLIYASGFEVTTFITSRLGFEIHGLGGVSITDAWENGASTLHGVFASDFPNLLMYHTTQGGAAINFVHVLDELSIHAAYVIAHCLANDIETVEPTAEAEEAWFHDVMRRVISLGAFYSACTPSYANNEGGMPDKRQMRSGAVLDTMDFADILKRWRQTNSLPGLNLVPGKVVA
jgi:cation diffusion facilitator CzcD-associated flavoprotein CzcO